MDYSTIMEFLRSGPTPEVARFMARLRPNRGRGRLEVCERCLTCHADKTSLWRHARAAHGNDAALTCPVSGCDRAFSSLSASGRHAELHLFGGGGRSYACELCGREYGTLAASHRHAAASHPEALAELCGVCGRYAVDVAALVAHVRDVHGPELRTGGGGPVRARRVIRCDVCAKRYGNNRLMREHRRLHETDDGGNPAPTAFWRRWRADMIP